MSNQDLASSADVTSDDSNVVLIVDDDLSYRLMLSTALSRAGFRALEAADGAQGIAVFEREQPDMVLLDVVMPGMDGFEVCQALRSHQGGRYTPIIMLTNLDDGDSIERAYDVGASDFITKPVDIIILRSRLHYLLRAHRYLMHFDELTGLPNRSLLLEQLKRAIANAKRRNTAVAIMLIDLDHFKRVTETQGYQVGDRILREVSERLGGALRYGDYIGRSGAGSRVRSDTSTLARVGGDQFGVVLYSISRIADVAAVARRLREDLNRPFEIAGEALYITASIGISAYPLDGDDPQSLILDAEIAKNHAKELGRDRYQFHTDKLNAQTRKNFSIESRLRRALDAGELALHYQPKIDIQNNRVAGFEALARWTDSELGEVPPQEFVTIAEQTGLILPLGEWVLSTASAHMAELSAAGCNDIILAINVSAAQFKQPDLAGQIQRAIEASAVDPTTIEIELTEGVLLEDSESSIRTLNEISAIGVRVSLDDFGTGYSSLSYLKRLPLRALKIDKSFILDLTSDRDAAVIVEAIIALGHTLSLEVLAEGVETGAQLDYLVMKGCDQVQGFFYSKALPAGETLEWMRGFATR